MGIGARKRAKLEASAAIAVVALLAVLALPSATSAAPTYSVLPFSPITGEATSSKFHFPNGVAVDEASGNLFVNDSITSSGIPGKSGDWVDVLGAEGGVPVGVASPYRVTTEPYFFFEESESAAAFDNSPTSPARGTLYVLEGAGGIPGEALGRVKEFTRNPVSEEYEETGELVPSTPLSFATDLAIDAKGDVFVNDAGSTQKGKAPRVVEFSPAGAQIASIDTFATLPGQAVAQKVAVDDAGDLFVRGIEGQTYKYPANGAGEVNPASYVQITPAETGSGEERRGKVGGIAVDLARNLLYVLTDGRIEVFDASGEEADPQPLGEFGKGVLEPVKWGPFYTYRRSRIAIDSAAGRIYVSGASEKKVLAFGYGPPAPTVKIGAASPVNASRETVAGTVNPEGEAIAECRFEYGETTAYGSSVPCEGSLPTDSADHPVSATLTGLTAATEYHYRLVAVNANGESHSLDRTFTTLAGERARTDAATEVGRTKATLNATVFPEGTAIEGCSFEYGTSESYGSTAPCAPEAASIPVDEEGHAVAAALTGLSPSTTYHFRVSTEGELGPTSGEDETFATGAVAITGAAGPIGGVQASVAGAVFPEGKALEECFFEYGASTSYGSTAPCAGGAIPADEGEHEVSAQLIHLVPNGSTYHYRLTTVGGYGTNHGQDKTLTTAETVITGAATGIAGHSFTANGTIDPEEAPLSECRFEYGLTAAYGASAPCEAPGAAEVVGSSPVAVHAVLSGLEGAKTYHYRLVAATADGAAKGKDKTAATSSPPTIREAWAQSVTTTEAQLKAKVSPEGFPTTYRIEYGTTTAYGQSTPEAAVGSNAQPHTLSNLLEGLQPATEYHWRVVASSELGTVQGEDHVFRTYAPAAPQTDCPNQPYRSGPSGALPDCRAYEMVSPLDKEGGEIRVLVDITTGLPTVMNQSAADGEALAYGSYRAFGGAESALYTTQYIARRHGPQATEPGWRSEAISPPQTTAAVGTIAMFEPQFKLFSEDLCAGWLVSFGDPPLAEGAAAGYQDLYRRDNCAGTPSYEALTVQQPPEEAEPELQGVAADGEEAIYRLPLSQKLYAKGAGGLGEVCVLPGGAPAAGCTAGGSWGANVSPYNTRVENALSADGSRVFWTGPNPANPTKNGPLYLRENPLGEGAECAGAAAPCTIAVSAAAEEETGSVGAGGGGSQYWGAAPDGSTAVFATGAGLEDLYEYDVGGEATRRIAGRVVGVAGIGADASRVYFVSREDLDGSGPAQAGKPNLYLRDGGQGGANVRFVAALGEADMSGLDKFSPVAAQPWLHATRTSPDGGQLAFVSFGAPTGYDNTDLGSGEADAEVYLYDASADGGAGKLVCASCNPSGQRPAGQQFSYGVVNDKSPWIGAKIPVPETNLRAAQALSANGQRLFFESYDSLALSDANGAGDVYQWEAPGEGSCTESSPEYSPPNGGCVALVSSGKSPASSTFTEADPEGENAFFTTLSSLVAQDPGVPDVYDARVGGGLPAPKAPAAQCEGEACQSAPEAPNDPTPASEAFRGAGNVVEEAPATSSPRRSCAKGKVKRRGRCVAKHHKRKHAKKHRRRARHGRRAAR